jgi:hypothetical protein
MPVDDAGDLGSRAFDEQRCRGFLVRSGDHRATERIRRGGGYDSPYIRVLDQVGDERA